MQKVVETRSSLSNTCTIQAQSCVTPNYILYRQRVTHDCASILDSIAKGTFCFHYFLHDASLHRHSLSGMIFTLVQCSYSYSYSYC